MFSQIPFFDTLQPRYDALINGLAFDPIHPVVEGNSSIVGFKDTNLSPNRIHAFALTAVTCM